jgi:hypothetical protein
MVAVKRVVGLHELRLENSRSNRSEHSQQGSLHHFHYSARRPSCLYDLDDVGAGIGLARQQIVELNLFVKLSNEAPVTHPLVTNVIHTFIQLAEQNKLPMSHTNIVKYMECIVSAAGLGKSGLVIELHPDRG